jgi:L-histidine Nalpha-methyltransferase
VWNAAQRRVEMHLVSRRAQRVRIPRAGCEVAFEEGESIWTESSYKYHADEVVSLVEAGGFRCHEQWIESEARFALTLFLVA